MADEMGVPDLQRAQHVTGAGGGERRIVLLPARAPPPPPPSRGSRTQQGVALLEHPIEVGAYSGEARRAGDEQIVEETAALGRVALDQREVLGREQHRPQQAEGVAGPARRGSGSPGRGWHVPD